MHSRLSRIYLAGLLLSVSLLAGGCGFTMLGQDLGLPFKTIAIQGSQGVANEVKQILQDQPGIKLVTKSVESQVVLTITSQVIERNVVAFSAAGRPRQIQLRIRVSYQVNDGYAIEITGVQEISQTRDLSISDAEVLAIGKAETFIIDDMQKDIAQQLVRRLRAIKLPG